MKTSAEILNNYLGLLRNLNHDTKLELIKKLVKSIKKDKSSMENCFERSFGALEDKKSADQIIEELKSSRNFTREIESI
ncbi:MAG: hypothetical protein K8R53_13595 [Bacteroidales bacterium]|nr:hypothetical protein [Bacteroidales bacterium]